MAPIANPVQNESLKAPVESNSHAWANKFPCSDDDEIERGREHSVESPSVEKEKSPNGKKVIMVQREASRF